MSRRSLLIALLVIEALSWCFANESPFRLFLSQFQFTVAGSTMSLLPLLAIVALALATIIGALSHTWQGAIALNLIASLLAVTLFFPPTLGIGMSALSLMAPLAALGWFGWLLRFVRAELAA